MTCSHKGSALQDSPCQQGLQVAQGYGLQVPSKILQGPREHFYVPVPGHTYISTHTYAVYLLAECADQTRLIMLLCCAMSQDRIVFLISQAKGTNKLHSMLWTTNSARV